MLQAAVLDCRFLDPFPFSDDSFVPAEVDVRRRNVAQTFMVTLGVIILDEGSDLTFKITWQIIIFQQDAVFHSLMPAFDLALGLGMERRTAHMIHFLFFQPIGQFARYIA